MILKILSSSGHQWPKIIFMVSGNHMSHARQGSFEMISDLLSGTLHVDGLQPSTP